MAGTDQQRVDLVDTHKSPLQRRWLRIAIIAVVPLAITIALVIQWFSRLNGEEKQILKEWSFADFANTQIIRHIRFEPDRTFLLRSSDGVAMSGRWRISDKELTICLKREDFTASGYLQSIDYQIDRLLHPQNWSPIKNHVALEELSQSSVRLRTTDGTKIVYRRSTSAGD